MLHRKEEFVKDCNDVIGRDTIFVGCDFVIVEIRPSTYNANGRMVIEIRAHLGGMTLSNIDALSRDEARRLSPQEEVELLLRDRRQHVEELVVPALARGAVVILDRYFPSMVAYQGAAGLPVIHTITTMASTLVLLDIVWISMN